MELYLHSPICFYGVQREHFPLSLNKRMRVFPCRRFAACNRSLNGMEVVISVKLPDNISRPQFRLSLLGSLATLWSWRHLATKVGSKGGGKVMATYP